MGGFPIEVALSSFQLLLQLVFQFAKASGLDADQIDKAYEVALEQFLENDPNLLPDVRLPLPSGGGDPPADSEG